MLIDHRTYTCRPGTIKLHLKLYEEYGYKAQSRHLGKPWLYAATESGDPNSYVHIWVYESAGDREAKRQALAADPDWAEYLKRSREAAYLVSQKNSLMTPVGFAPAPEVRAAD
ncbi:NIPSNAP family protein [Acuticoccus sediminis]|uniref:NIPSNAP family protein n=1 Tax=Acuticoccus sediminis TaxID=2184697 RepID=A0A8B2NLF1_9HYPH|nr:NIPSNAP family protein [Acuticoccus sediminis]RAH98423.1 NIPSNAP family protein [Acuticoccus sediminis]